MIMTQFYINMHDGKKIKQNIHLCGKLIDFDVFFAIQRLRMTKISALDFSMNQFSTLVILMIFNLETIFVATCHGYPNRTH